jgi:hypothetical protein
MKRMSTYAMLLFWTMAEFVLMVLPAWGCILMGASLASSATPVAGLFGGLITLVGLGFRQHAEDRADQCGRCLWP